MFSGKHSSNTNHSHVVIIASVRNDTKHGAILLEERVVIGNTKKIVLRSHLTSRYALVNARLHKVQASLPLSLRNIVIYYFSDCSVCNYVFYVHADVRVSVFIHTNTRSKIVLAKDTINGIQLLQRIKSFEDPLEKPPIPSVRIVRQQPMDISGSRFEIRGHLVCVELRILCYTNHLNVAFFAYPFLLEGSIHIFDIKASGMSRML